MVLVKELINYSLFEIGDVFGGWDYIIVLYVCCKIKELREESFDVREDYINFLRLLILQSQCLLIYGVGYEFYY